MSGNLHGNSPKEYRHRRKCGDAGDVAKQVKEITRRLKVLEERSQRIIFQKAIIESLLQLYRQQQADDFWDE